MTSEHRTAGRLQSVDGMRGLAALLVVWMHTSEIFSALRTEQGKAVTLFHDLAQWGHFGLLGVSVFFAVSGYLIPSSIHGQRLPALKKFLVRRFFRLYPAFWLSIPMGLMTTWWLWGRQMPRRDLALNFTMLTSIVNAAPVQGLYWTLEVELLFYALCAAIFFAKPALLGSTRFLFFTALLFFGWYCAPQTRSFVFGGATTIHLSVMFWGAGLRALVNSNRSLLRSRGNTLYLGAWIVWLIIFDRIPTNATSGVGGTFFHVSAAAICAFYACLQLGQPRNALLSYCGKVSYSIYLFHPVVFYALFWLVRFALPPICKQLNTGFYIVIVAALTIALSSIVYRWIEAPSMALGKKLAP
jgi:peptidoglycan/LPS O-acetylase OafA/YrhL